MTCCDAGNTSVLRGQRYWNPALPRPPGNGSRGDAKAGSTLSSLQAPIAAWLRTAGSMGIGTY